jgi:hypothetical protein
LDAVAVHSFASLYLCSVSLALRAMLRANSFVATAMTPSATL